MNKRKNVAAGLVALLAGAGLALTTVGTAHAHTPEVTASCGTLTINLTNYSTVTGSEAVMGTRVVQEAVPAQDAVYGEPPLITPGTDAVPANPGITKYEYKQLFTGKTTWAESDPGFGWYATGNTKVVGATEEIPGTEPVYGEPELISPAVPAVPEVTEEYVITPAVEAEENDLTVKINGDVKVETSFGTTYTNVILVDEIQFSYSVEIDAIGTEYDRTIEGTFDGAQSTNPTAGCYVAPIIPEEPVTPEVPVTPEEPVTPAPVDENPVTPPATQPEPVTENAPVLVSTRSTAGTDTLAYTGGESSLGLLFGGGLLAAAGAALMIGRRALARR